MSWRCERQALVALSVAEAELIEAISATQMAYGISVITEELHQVPAEIVIKVDNAAAVGLSNESSGSWKTRHLKARAFHLREAVRLREIRIEHIPGLYQLGDLGTKAFHRPRLLLTKAERKGELLTLEGSPVRGCHSWSLNYSSEKKTLAHAMMLPAPQSDPNGPQIATPSLREGVCVCV